MKQRVASVAVALLMGAGMAGCGEDQPPVCDSAEALRTSVDDVKAVDVTASGGVDALLTALATVEDNLTSVKADAKAEFSSPISAVEGALATLQTSATAAKADPTATTLSAVGTALSAVTTSVDTLTTEVASTC